MAQLRYGPNGENLVPGTKAYEQGSPFPPNSSSTSGLPTFTPRTKPILIPGVKDPVSGDEAKAWFKFLKNNNKVRYQQFIAELAARGVSKSAAQKVWGDAVDWTQTIDATSSNPEDYLDILDPSDYQGATKKYGTTKQRDERVTQYSPSSAAQIVSDTMEQESGRTASANEIAAGTAAMNAAAMKEPGIFEGTTTTSPGGKGFELGQSVTKGTQTTGFDPTMFARNFARSQPDFAESFAAKNFLKLISGLLTDPNAIGAVVGDGR
jgi:hypothetical protein